MTRHRYPNLFLAGAPKCGTTSLAFYLGQHPNVFAPLFKEPVFFGSDLTGKSRIKEDGYLQLFDAWSDEKYAIDASTHYSYSACAAEEIVKSSPNAQIIIMVRNPIEAAHSMYHQLRFNGSEPLTTFEASLAAEAERAADPAPLKGGYRESRLYRRVFAFSENIPRFEKVFGSDNVQVLFLEDLKSDALGVVKTLCAQLGLEQAPVDDFSFDVRNTAKRSRTRLIHRLAISPPEWLRPATRPFPKSLRLKLRNMLAELNTAPATNPPLREDTRAFLSKEFAGEIDWLEDRFQRDLSHWRA